MLFIRKHWIAASLTAFGLLFLGIFAANALWRLREQDRVEDVLWKASGDSRFDVEKDGENGFKVIDRATRHALWAGKTDVRSFDQVQLFESGRKVLFAFNEEDIHSRFRVEVVSGRSRTGFTDNEVLGSLLKQEQAVGHGTVPWSDRESPTYFALRSERDCLAVFPAYVGKWRSIADRFCDEISEEESDGLTQAMISECFRSIRMSLRDPGRHDVGPGESYEVYMDRDKAFVLLFAALRDQPEPRIDVLVNDSSHSASLFYRQEFRIEWSNLTRRYCAYLRMRTDPANPLANSLSPKTLSELARFKPITIVEGLLPLVHPTKGRPSSIIIRAVLRYSSGGREVLPLEMLLEESVSELLPEVSSALAFRYRITDVPLGEANLDAQVIFREKTVQTVVSTNLNVSILPST